MADKFNLPSFSQEELKGMVEGMAEMISRQSKARRVKPREAPSNR